MKRLAGRIKKLKFGHRLRLITIVLSLFICSQPQVSSASTGRPLFLSASWYSIASLKKEGTWKIYKGRMANGHLFNARRLTCATRLYSLGDRLRITNLYNNKQVVVTVTDRISERFAQTRIDLSKRAFSKIADLEQGIVSVMVEEL